MTINGRDFTTEFMLIVCSPFALLGALLAFILARSLLRSPHPETLASNKVALLFGAAAGLLLSLLFGGVWVIDLFEAVRAEGTISGAPLLAKLASLITIVGMAIWFAIAITVMNALRLRRWPFDHTQTEDMAALFDKAAITLRKAAITITRRGGAA
jgi:hypothetical protein